MLGVSRESTCHCTSGGTKTGSIDFPLPYTPWEEALSPVVSFWISRVSAVYWVHRDHLSSVLSKIKNIKLLMYLKFNFIWKDLDIYYESYLRDYCSLY